ncbi:FAD:protein FMN transferase [Gammaproteobacteria bacterium]|nr:FAD:protein FMN transferase [Gammaproteobacteria bacterium]
MAAKRFRNVALFLAAVCLLAGCGESHYETQLSGQTMGTSWSIVIDSDHEPDAGSIAAGVEAVLESVNATFSTWREDSELSQLNADPSRGQRPISEQFADLLDIALRWSERSNGAFDVTIGPLVELWGFGSASEKRSVPDAKQIAQARKRVGWEQVYVEAHSGELMRESDGMRLDFSAIAKGYGVELLSDFLVDAGYPSHLVEIGGEVQVGDSKLDGGAWRVGIVNPERIGPRALRVVPLVGLAMATSGDYRNYYEIDGVKYSHTLDPVTARPVTHALASVSVIHPSCTVADVLSTTLMVLGPEKGLAFANQWDVAAYFLVTQDEGYQRVASRAMQPFLNVEPES